MKNKTLYVFVEGSDDERFFTEIIKPSLERRYNAVQILKYREEASDWVVRFIRTIKKMRDNYLFVADIDTFPCVTAKKAHLAREYRNLDQHSILVIRMEIESWYLAGLNRSTARKLGLRIFPRTDDVRKEDFNTRQPKPFDSRIDFMREILKVYSIAEAKDRNTSFKYFVEKYDLE